MESPRTARDKLAAMPLPKDKADWPEYKAVHAEAAKELALADAAADEKRRLKRVRELASELRYLATTADVRERWQRIKAIIDDMKGQIP